MPNEPPLFNYPKGHPVKGANYLCAFCGLSDQVTSQCAVSASGEHFMEVDRGPRERQSRNSRNDSDAV
jgi:hypothetical protein